MACHKEQRDYKVETNQDLYEKSSVASSKGLILIQIIIVILIAIFA